MPTLPLGDLLAGAHALPAPLDRPGTSFWFCGRVAIHQAIRALGLRAGQRVALPAFCCGSELDVFVQAGLEPRTFALTATLDPEPDSFAAALDGAAAALTTHYFGFAAALEPVRALCRAAGVPLIEDCAHALYTQDAHGALGARADLAIFSIAKTLAVPDGGALLVNRPLAAPLPAASAPPAALVRQRTLSLAARHLQAHPLRAVALAARLPGLARRRFAGATAEPDRESQDGLARVARFDRALATTAMSARALQLLGATHHARVVAARRRHYARLLEALAGCRGLRALFPALAAGTCPLALPVLVDDPVAFRARLAAGPSLGIRQMWPWYHPAVDWQACGNAAALKRRVFILPVHQSLGAHELDHLCATLAGWS
ncbi:MAG: DegT/DnrJ/EryC1/StrS family aminotransferase [Gammaproteobacteria bacterium]